MSDTSTLVPDRVCPDAHGLGLPPLDLSVAPMMDWTDRHCRVFHRRLAPSARLYTEMVHAQAVLHGDRARLLGFDPEEQPLALQLGGGEARPLAQAARIGADLGYTEINLNVGCPSDRVQAGRFGACLMREPDLVADCVAAMIAAVPASVAVTVKCRLGVDQDAEYETLSGFVDKVATGGCRHFIVHARKAWLQGLSPKENRQVPPLRHELVHQLKRERPSLAITLNGGVLSLAGFATHAGCVDGVMLGRAAWDDPWLLHRIHGALSGEPLSDRATLLMSMQGYARTQMSAGVPLRALARPWLGLFRSEPGGRAFRRSLSESMARDDDPDRAIGAALAAVSRPDCQQAA